MSITANTSDTAAADAARLRSAQLLAARAFARHLLEVLSRRRPATHLARVTAPDVHALVSRIAERGAFPESVGGRPHLPRDPHVTAPATGIVEACTRIAGDGRSRALAFRLERDAATRTWRCTRLALG